MRKILNNRYHNRSHQYLVSQLEKLVGYSVKRIHCCINHCIAFTGEYANAEVCPCGESRYQAIPENLGPHVRIRRRALVPKPKSFHYYVPIIPRLILQWANQEQAQIMKDYSVERENLTFSQMTHVSDFWNGRLYEDLKDAGYFPVCNSGSCCVLYSAPLCSCEVINTNSG